MVEGFTKKETICTQSVQTVKDLIFLLETFVATAGGDAEVVYVENGAETQVTCRLIENTLTDGSKVYDVRVS